MQIQLKPLTIHIWTANLAGASHEEQNIVFLSPDEVQRAERLLYPLQRQRFVAARAILRQILSFYLNISPQQLLFSYSNYKKPLLAYPANVNLQFNVAHSHDLAVYAVTLDQAIGIDIEKIEISYPINVVKRFFHPSEYHWLMQLPASERANAFYHLWSRKEAIMKAVGKGLALSSRSFSVAPEKPILSFTLENKSWTLCNLALNPNYAGALAIHHRFTAISHWQFQKEQAYFKEKIDF